MELNRTHLIDAIDAVEALKGKIDLIVADPPYEFEAMAGGVHKVGNGGAVKYQDIIDIGTNQKYVDIANARVTKAKKQRVLTLTEMQI